MKPYPSYKESGVEWIGEIPIHWFANKVSRNTYVKGRIGWKGLTSDEFIDDGPYLITGTDFIKGRIDWKNTYHISQKRYEEDPFIILKEGDVLITKDGTIGKVVYVDSLPGPATLNSGIFVTRPVNVKYEPLFFYWLLNSSVFQIFFDYESSGSTIQHLYQNVFEDFKFPLPPLPEQQQIVSFLDNKTQLIDSLIKKTEKKIELLKEKRICLINHCVTKGLKPNVEMKDSGVEWIGEIPKEWKKTKVKYFSLITLGKMLTPQDKGGYHLKPYLRSQNIQVNTVDIDDVKEMWFSEDELMKYKLKKGDLLVNEGGDVGRTCMWMDELDECYIQNSVNRVDIYNGNKKYYQYHFYLHHQTGYFDSIVNRVSIPHLTKEKLENVVFIKPSPTEQQQIVEYLDEQTQEIDSTIKKETQRIALLKEYRQSLISEVVTGKIDVRNEVAV